MLEIYVDEQTFRASEEDVRKVHSPLGSVGIHYAFNKYGRDVQHILDLKDAVLKDYPNMSISEMEIWIISKEESIRHAGYTTLFVRIPIDDFLQLRREHKIGIK